MWQTVAAALRRWRTTDRNDREGIAGDWKAAEAICYSRGVPRAAVIRFRNVQIVYISLTFEIVLAFDGGTNPEIIL